MLWKDKYSTNIGISSLPVHNIGVMTIGDASIELNDVTVEYRNIYDGDTYLYTVMNVVGTCLVDVSSGGGENSVSSQLNKFIHYILGDQIGIKKSNNRIIGGDYKSANAAVRNAFKSLARDPGQIPHSSNVSSGDEDEGDSSVLPAEVFMFDRGDANLIFVPPRPFALSIHNGLFFDSKSITANYEAFDNSKNNTFIHNCGFYIHPSSMFKPIEISSIAFGGFTGDMTMNIGISVSVYFHAYSHIFDSANGVVSRANQLSPACHKWSIGSVWRAGSKLNIIVSGKVMRRSMFLGVPSIYDFLPRCCPGIHLLSLDVASDDNGMVTSYKATFEVDYVAYYCTKPTDGSSRKKYHDKVNEALKRVIYIDILEDAQSITQGTSAISSMYEASLQKGSADIQAIGQTASAAQSAIGAIRGAYSDYMENMAALGKESLSNIASTALSIGIGLLTGGIGGIISAIGSAIAGGIKHMGLKAKAAAVQDRFKAATNQAGVSANMAANMAAVSRSMIQRSIDAKTAEALANTVVRSATIRVVGIPGTSVADLQLVAYAIAEQVYFGWLKMAIPPKLVIGWMLGKIVSGNIAKEVASYAESQRGELAKLRILDSQGRSAIYNTGTLLSTQNMAAFGEKALGVGGADQYARSVIDSITNQPLLRSARVPSPTYNANNAEAFYRKICEQFLKYIESKDNYTRPRDYPYSKSPIGDSEDKAGKLISAMFETADDVLSVLLSLFGIRTMKTYIQANHLSSEVILSLNVAFNTSEFSGNSILQSLWRVYGKRFGIEPFITKKDSYCIPSCSINIPAIIPITHYIEYNKYLDSSRWNVPYDKGSSPIHGLLDNSKIHKMFMHWTDLYKKGKGKDTEYADGINDGITDEAAHRHTISMDNALRMFAHGSSMGTSSLTPVITPDVEIMTDDGESNDTIELINRCVGKRYISHIGAGVFLVDFSYISSVGIDDDGDDGGGNDIGGSDIVINSNSSSTTNTTTNNNEIDRRRKEIIDRLNRMFGTGGSPSAR